MKLAVVGKGGSGKSTIAALLAQQLAEQRTVLFVDADINMHAAGLLGITVDPAKALSDATNSLAIRRILKGTNPRITNERSFVKTTPPGKGSHILHIEAEDPIISAYAEQHDTLLFMHVGTYREDGIGTSCYHTNLAILENLLSHTKTKTNIFLADMVAGTDAFSNSLHAQFDALVFIIEPSIESVRVYEQYRRLAEAAGIADRIVLIANKIEDEEDEAFIKAHAPAACITYDRQIKRSRQHAQSIEASAATRAQIERLAEKLLAMPRHETIRHLHILHERYARLDYVQAGLGDITGQIDPEFQ